MGVIEYGSVGVVACSNEQVNQNIAIISGQLGNHTSWELSALSAINENIFGLRGEVRDLTNAITSLLNAMRGTP